MKRLGFILMIVAVLASLALPASAQRFTASIRGQVTSADTEATLPGATVTAVNTDTGFTRTVVTNDTGTFVFGELAPGPYTVTIEFPEFKTYVVQDVVLNVADVREISAGLEVGAIEEEITVTSPVIIVETIGGEVASTITSEEIQELPLNGRNFAQLTQLMPGVTAVDGIDFKNKGLLSSVDMSVSGSMVTGNQWAVDGANNNDTGSNRTVLVTPSVDAIEEFKVHRNSYGPEFGGAGGAQINLITKSGTNQYQGSVYAFMRTDSLNEKNAILEKAKLDKEDLDRKDYGFTFGGPIIKEKLLFFLSYEINDETRGTVRSAAVPTAAERAGDFSQSSNPPVDPLTGQPFPGNVIPADRLSPGGLAFLSLYPDPNNSGAALNWAGTVNTDIDWNQINARMDWNVTDKTRALVRYTQDDWENPGPNAGEAAGLCRRGRRSLGRRPLPDRRLGVESARRLAGRPVEPDIRIEHHQHPDLYPVGQ